MNTSVTHANLMDGVYAKQRHIYDLTRKYYLLGRDRAIEELDATPNSHVLEIGCGTGRNLIVAARRFPEARFYGLDISVEMLRTASANIAKAGLTNRISLAQGDAAGFDSQALFGRSRFDAVLMSYTLSMIPPWDAALETGMDALADDGRLVFVDFWDQQGLPAWSRALLCKWLQLFHVTPRETLARKASMLAADRQRTCRFEPLYRGYACIGMIS